MKIEILRFLATQPKDVLVPLNDKFKELLGDQDLQVLKSALASIKRSNWAVFDAETGWLGSTRDGKEFTLDTLVIKGRIKDEGLDYLADVDKANARETTETKRFWAIFLATVVLGGASVIIGLLPSTPQHTTPQAPSKPSPKVQPTARPDSLKNGTPAQQKSP